jgi:hypothetical protein
MDATRPRRIRDSARQGWYARWRSIRFARHFGFASNAAPASGLKPPCPCGVSVWPAMRRCA